MNSFLVQEKTKCEIINNLFEYKYRPKVIEEYIGNKIAIKQLQKWLELKKRKPYALIYGYTGKTLLAKLLLKEYNVIIIENNDLETFKNIITSENTTLTEKKSAFIIKDIDKNIGEGVRYKNFIKILDKNVNNLPVICLYSGHKIKKRYNTPTKIELIFVDYPEEEELKMYCKNIITKEKISIPDQSIVWIIASSNYNFMKILNNLQILSCLKKKKYNQKEIKNILEFAENDTILEAYEVLDETFNDKTERNIEEQINNCYNDQPLIVDLYYSNVGILPIESYYKVIDNMSSGDIFQKYIYRNCEWEMREYSICYSCILPHQEIRKHLKKNKVYKLKKNQLNNLPWSIVKNMNIYQGISNKTKTRYRPYELKYIFDNILNPLTNVSTMKNLGIDAEDYQKLSFTTKKEIEKIFKNVNEY
jgi:DNA polymerase III gamma/tau subunit